MTMVPVASGAGARVPSQRSLKVDVVVPCYNYARFLRACVASVLNQRGVDVRVLVIDDTSSDDTPEVVAGLAAGDARVHSRRHTVNAGHIATYNEGLLDWADGDLTVLLSADDVLAPGALARAAAVFTAHPGVGMVYGRSVYHTGDSRLPRTVSLPLGTSVWSGHDWIAGRCRAGRNVISSPEVVVRTSVQHSVGGYRSDLPHAGDLEMWLRIAAVSDIGYVRGRPAAYYRVHSDSMFRTQFADVLADLVQRQAVFERFFVEHPQVRSAPTLLAAARRAIARDALWRACRLYDRDLVDGSLADDLLAFALDCAPEADRLPEYRALQRRRFLGPAVCSRTQLFLAPHAIKQGRNWVDRQVWKLRGV